MVHFNQLKIAKDILGKSSGILKTEFSVLDVEDELASLEMTEKRSRPAQIPEEDWGLDSMTKQGVEFEREVSLVHQRQGASSRTTRSTSKKHKPSSSKEILTFNLTFSLKNIPSHYIEEVRECILMGLGPILSSGLDINTSFEVPKPTDDAPSTSAADHPPKPPPEKKRKTEDTSKDNIKKILMDKIKAGVQIRSRFVKKRFKTIKIGNHGLTENDVANILKEGNFVTNDEFLKLCIKKSENAKVILSMFVCTFS